MKDNLARILALAAAGNGGDIADLKHDVEVLDEKVDAAIAAGFKPLVVEQLPTQDISNKILYLVPKEDSGEEDVYDEYLYVDNEWEHLGTTAIDLSDYYTKSEINDITGVLSSLVTVDKTNLVNAINELGGKGSFNHVTVDTYIEDLPDGWNLVDDNKKLKLYKGYPNSYFKDSVMYLCFKQKQNGGNIIYLAITWSGLTYYDETTQGQAKIYNNPSLIWGVVGNNFITFTPIESVKNKVTSLSSSSTDTQYPSAKCVYDSQASQDALIGAKVNKSSFVYDSNTETLSITIS